MKIILFWLALSFLIISSANAETTIVTITETHIQNNRLKSKGDLRITENNDIYPIGKWTYWHENGRKKAEGNFKEGAMDGIWTYWYDNGQTEEEIEYSGNAIHGRWHSWHKNGQKKEEGSFSHNQIVGSYTGWHENGQKHFEIYYLPGYSNPNKITSRIDGIWITWHENGQKQAEANFERGELIGEWKYWDKDGNQIAGTNTKK